MKTANAQLEQEYIEWCKKNNNRKPKFACNLQAFLRERGDRL